MWNETDAGRRRDVIASVWAEDGRYRDPIQQGDGIDGINAMVGVLQQQMPGCQVHRTGEIDAHHDCARFSWEVVAECGTVVVDGIDVALISDGRLRLLAGFFDREPVVPAAGETVREGAAA
jgi:hypothetical protein